mgnify:CR=1 FL=1
MKVFLTLQAALIAVTLLLCLHARGLSEDVGITRMDTIEKIHNSNCDYIAVIHDTEELYDRFSQFDSENADYGIGRNSHICRNSTGQLFLFKGQYLLHP